MGVGVQTNLDLFYFPDRQQMVQITRVSSPMKGLMMPYHMVMMKGLMTPVSLVTSYLMQYSPSCDGE